LPRAHGADCFTSHKLMGSDKLQKASASARLLIAVAGIPGSGKTTLAALVAKGINDQHHARLHARFPNAPETSPSQPDIASVVPLDGYHLTRKQLSAMADPKEAHYRRGAAFTFDPNGYLELVKTLRRPLGPETVTIYAPSFDHAVKDPVEDDISIPPTARVVIFEGLYLALDFGPWREAAELMDELWFVDVPIEVATERVVKRHVATGLSPNEAHARERVLGSDMRNGREVLEHRLDVQELITSVEDDGWKPKTAKEVEAVQRVPTGERKTSLMELAESGVGL
jgi:pantothenate kinase